MYTSRAIEIYLFGAPVIRAHGKLIADLPGKTQALLCYLAMTRQTHPRLELATLLWGELSEQNARSNLRKAIQQLRATLPDHFQSDRRSATLKNSSTIWTDVVAFEEQIAQAQQTNDRQTLDDAIQLYRADFLAGFFVRNAPDFEAWQLMQRDRLRGQVAGALQSLSQQWAAKEEIVRAIGATRRLLELEPWREEAHRQLMTLLAHAGQREAALLHYERCRQTLQTELDVDPGLETVALYEQIRANQLEPLTATSTAAALVIQPPLNLPAATTPLLGRATEIAQLVQLLADSRQRLVSIVAPGGMGKSHLALEVASALFPHFADGVYFVALAPLAETETIVPTIAASVGYTFQSDGRTPVQQLLDYLHNKELLLLLDNAEHLLAGVALFTAILEAAPEVRLLVTTRERLRLHSETLFPLVGLTFAGDDRGGSAAAELFVQTAQRARPSFTPTTTDWSAIQQICRLVGGMPLGVILAATWVEVLSPPEIAAEISRSLDFLAADLRDMPDRHHSLRAIFETTWQRLSKEEQRIFQQLAIFRGGFTREAAVQVANASLATLTVLSHKALIQIGPNGRYMIHELLRQFALETLGNRLADMHDKHSAYYCEFLAQRDGDLKGARQQAAMAEIEADSENIRVAWRWAAEKGYVEQLIDGLDTLGLFYLWRSRLHEGVEICQVAIEQSDITFAPNHTTLEQSDRIRLTIRTLIWLSSFHRHLKQIQQAQVALQQARNWHSHAVTLDFDILPEEASLLQEEAESLYETDQMQTLQFAQQSLNLIQELGDRWRKAQLLALIARLLRDLGLLSQAKETAESGLTLCRELGDIRGLANALYSLAQTAKSEGRLDEADKFMRQSIALFAEVGDRDSEARATHHLAVNLVFAGNFVQSLKIFEKSMSVHSALGLPGEPITHSISLSFALMHLGQYREALSHLQHAMANYNGIGSGYAHKDLGRLAFIKGDYVKSEEHLLKAMTTFQLKGDANGLGQTLGCLGILTLRRHNLQQAQEYIYQNLEIAANTKVHLPSLTALTSVALLRATKGDEADAIELYTVALQHGHVANSRWYYDVVGQQIDALAETLPAPIVEAARARGRVRDWRTTIQELWAEWTDAGSAARQRDSMTEDRPKSAATTVEFPLIGREPEWQLVWACWQNLHHPHFLWIGGEAGIGKTRLAEELLVAAERAGTPAARTRAHALQGQLAYGPITDWLRSPPLQNALAQLEDVWLTEVARLLPELLIDRPLLTAPEPLQGKWQRQRFFDALLQAFGAVEGPLLLLLDDLQWTDMETLEWIQYLVERSNAKLLVIGTVRSDEIDAAHPLHHLCRQLQRHDRLTELSMTPLSATATTALAAQVAQQQLADEVATKLFDDTAGNPLFVVESMRGHLGKDVVTPVLVPSEARFTQEQRFVPAKIYSVIQARLAQLSPQAQQLAQLGATIGRSFDVTLLAKASAYDDEEVLLCLDELWQRRIVKEVDGVHFDFTHDRIRDVTYAEIGPMKQRLLHRKIASALELIHTKEIDAVSGQLAVHYAAAGLYREAADFYQRAALQSRKLYARQKVVEYREQAISAIEQLPETLETQRTKIDLLIALNRDRTEYLGKGHPRVAEALRAAHALVVTVGTPMQQVRVLNALTVYERLCGRWANAYELALRAIKAATALDNAKLIAYARYGVAEALMRQGYLEEAHTYFEQIQVMASSERASDDKYRNIGYVTRSAYCLWLLGFPEQSKVRGAKGIAIGHQLNAGGAATWLHQYCSILLFCKDIAAVDTISTELIAAAKACNDDFSLCWGYIYRGWLLIQQGNPVEGIELIRENLDTHHKVGDRFYECVWRALLAEAHIQLTQVDAALQEIERALSYANEGGDHHWDADLLRLKADCLLAQNAAPAEIEAHYQQAIDTARRQQARSLELRATTSLCRLWQQQGKVAAAHQLLADIYGWFSEGFDTHDLVTAKALLDELKIVNLP